MRYHNITHDDMLNGDGIRVVLWVSGCTHKCKGCQNPVTWNPDDGKIIGIAEWVELALELSKDYVAGITFSGGDPLHPQNRKGIANLIHDIKTSYPHKTVWLYTGFTWEEIMNDEEMKNIIMTGYIDVLVDGEFVESLADKKYKWAGSTNQRVIDVKRTLEKGEVILHANN